MAFTADGALIAPVVAVVNGVATLSVSDLPVGLHSILAEYEGDEKFGTSVSGAVKLEVVRRPRFLADPIGKPPILAGGNYATVAATLAGDAEGPLGEPLIFALTTAPTSAVGRAAASGTTAGRWRS